MSARFAGMFFGSVLLGLSLGFPVAAAAGERDQWDEISQRAQARLEEFFVLVNARQTDDAIAIMHPKKGVALASRGNPVDPCDGSRAGCGRDMDLTLPKIQGHARSICGGHARSTYSFLWMARQSQYPLDHHGAWREGCVADP